jgi:hypothetical protein
MASLSSMRGLEKHPVKAEFISRFPKGGQSGFPEPRRRPNIPDIFVRLNE